MTLSRVHFFKILPVWAVLFSAGLFLLPLSAAQAQRGWGAQAGGGLYAGLALGPTTQESGVTAVSGAELNEDDTGTSFFVGYALNERFAIEVSRVDLGEISLKYGRGDRFSLDGEPFVGLADGEITAGFTATGLAGKVFLPSSGPLTGYGKIGFASGETEATATSGGVSATASEDDSGLFFGLGGEYAIGDSVSLFLGYDFYPVEGGGNHTFLNFGARIRFQ